jgi:hypothetical protein
MCQAKPVPPADAAARATPRPGLQVGILSGGPSAGAPRYGVLAFTAPLSATPSTAAGSTIAYWK